MKIIKPSPLKSGDRLGIIATSTPIHVSSQETINRCYCYLKSKGFNVVEAPNCREKLGHAAGSPKDRADSVIQFFKDPKISGILAYWGGYQSHQLLEYLDFNVIKKNPKPFIGFSDTTALQIGIYAKTGLVCFSGPAGITFGKPTVPDFTWQYFKKVLINPPESLSLLKSSEFSDNHWWKDSSQTMKFNPNPGWKIFRQGKANGRLIGGNLGTMLLLAGTPFWPELKNSILFVEDDESESSMTIDRLFTQLRQMKVFDQIKGLIVGRFHSDVGFKQGDSFEMILEDALKGYEFPVITDLDFGHTDPVLTLPIGIKCHINTNIPEVRLTEKAVSFSNR